MKYFEDENRILKRWYSALAVFLVLFYPYGNHAYASKWYEKPFEFMFTKLFDWFLEPFVGLHEPAYHIFYASDGKLWGMYTQDQWNVAIKGGYNMMLFIVSFMLVAAIIKMGVQHGYSKFSASMKADITDGTLKILVGIILLYQFFPLVNVFFVLNQFMVDIFEAGIKDPPSLHEMGAAILTSADGNTAGESIEFTDLASGEDASWVEKGIVSLFSLGIAIWFKAYYIQRMIMISGLVVLAPVWISTIFFPKLSGITGYAFKELWAQVMAQTVHAAIFWLYFYLFGSDADWLTFLIALAVFIPVSESLRFAMGATSDSAGKLATVGTLAGFGTIMHGAKAFKSIGQGTKNAYLEKKGKFGTQGSGGQGPSNDKVGVKSLVQSGGRSYGGSSTSAMQSPNSYANRMRVAGHVASGVGSAAMRMAGNFSGMGISPIAQHLMAEGGSSVGSKMGYGAGAVTYGTAEGIAKKGKNTYQAYQGAKAQNPMMSREEAAETGTSSMQRISHNAVAAKNRIASMGKEAVASTGFRTDPIARRETLRRAGGTLGEAVFGREMGYEMGADMATTVMGKGQAAPKLARIQNNTPLTQVTTRDGSYLASMQNGQLKQETNILPGDPSLPKGVQVLQNYRVTAGENNVRQIEATSAPYAYQQVQEGGEMKTVKVDYPNVRMQDVNQFIDRTSEPMPEPKLQVNSRPQNPVDTRRRMT